MASSHTWHRKPTETHCHHQPSQRAEGTTVGMQLCPGVTYDGEQLVTPALRQEAAHDLWFGEGCYGL